MFEHRFIKKKPSADRKTRTKPNELFLFKVFAGTVFSIASQWKQKLVTNTQIK